jgi:hypothetical protein
MTIKTIHYSESRESAVGYLKQWKKFGAEAELSERESPEEAMETLRALIGKKLDEAVAPQMEYGTSYDNGIGENGLLKELPSITQWARPKTPDPKQDRVQQLIRDINACTSVDEKNSFGVQVGLISFSQMVSSHPELQTAYDNKLQELTTQ